MVSASMTSMTSSKVIAAEEAAEGVHDGDGDEVVAGEDAAHLLLVHLRGRRWRPAGSTRSRDALAGRGGDEGLQREGAPQAAARRR